MATTHFDLSDTAFLDAFEATSLPPELFTHEAHLRLAWLHLHRYGLGQSLVKIPIAIQNYVRALGAEDKYDEAVTIAAIRIVHHFLLQKPQLDFKQFISAFPQLKNDFRTLLSTQYA